MPSMMFEFKLTPSYDKYALQLFTLVKYGQALISNFLLYLDFSPDKTYALSLMVIYNFIPCASTLNLKTLQHHTLVPGHWFSQKFRKPMNS